MYTNVQHAHQQANSEFSPFKMWDMGRNLSIEHLKSFVRRAPIESLSFSFPFAGAFFRFVIFLFGLCASLVFKALKRIGIKKRDRFDWSVQSFLIQQNGRKWNLKWQENRLLLLAITVDLIVCLSVSFIRYRIQCIRQFSLHIHSHLLLSAIWDFLWIVFSSGFCFRNSACTYQNPTRERERDSLLFQLF